MIGVTFDAQAEEARPVPRGPGDGAGNSREAGIGLLLPDEAVEDDRHGVAHAAVFSHQAGSGLEPGAGLELFGFSTYQTVEQLDGGLVVAAIELFLDAPSDHPTQQILGEGRRRLLAERLAPPARRSSLSRDRRFS